MTIFGFNSKTKKALYQLGECITDPGADPQETEWLDVLKHIKGRYRIVNKVIRDPGSSAPTNDVLKHSHGIIVESAIKGPGSLKARVDLLADLLFRSKCLVIKGGELDIDLQGAKWSVNALDKSKWEFDKSVCSPDVSDSASYIAPFFTTRGGQDSTDLPKGEIAWLIEEAKKGLVERWKDLAPDKKPKASSTLWRSAPR